MFEQYAGKQFRKYHEARKVLLENPNCLIQLEKLITEHLVKSVSDDINAIVRDYNEASFLYPFWKNYPPDERGRAPRGDQFPWIEVGEHAVGTKLYDYFRGFNARDVGLPSGADQRFLVNSKSIAEATNGLTDHAWVFIDIKSVGPRDNFDHAVMSHNQISGEGKWDDVSKGVINQVLTASGSRASHPFHCSVPPIYVLSDLVVAPVIMLIVKPVYKMLNLNDPYTGGQPLDKITIASIPNGLLLTKNPNYLEQFPGLLYPGKDDKAKNQLKVRARISFSILSKIDSWRVQTINKIPSVQ